MSSKPVRSSVASEDLLTVFNRQGFFGPVDTTLSNDNMIEIANLIDGLLNPITVHPIYGRYSVRDWHLVYPLLLRLFLDPEVVRVVTAILGQDVLLWRTKVFAKAPGEGPLGWHQEWGAFNGEEIGNNRPALIPAEPAQLDPWNITVWFALDNVTQQMGPIRFAQGTHHTRFPIRMEPITRSEFWHDPFLGVSDAAEIIARANNNSLVLDIDTSSIFRGESAHTINLEECKKRVLAALKTQAGAVTLDFDPSKFPIVELPMRRGQFVVFSERTMHGSDANRTQTRRLGINGRYCKANTVVYPYRTDDSPIDGSNLNVANHACVIVSGTDKCGRNKIAPSDAGL